MYNPQLETFLRVADAGSFNKAAEESYITPTAVIKQINLLEESLGVKLFDRSHRGLTLTKAGRSMYQDARYIIQYCRDSVTRAKNAMQEDENIIRIGSSPMTPAQLLMDLWSRVQALHPDIKFQIVPFFAPPPSDKCPERTKIALQCVAYNCVPKITRQRSSSSLRFSGPPISLQSSGPTAAETVTTSAYTARTGSFSWVRPTHAAVPELSTPSETLSLPDRPPSVPVASQSPR